MLPYSSEISKLINVNKLNIDSINFLIHCCHKHKLHGKELVLFYIVSLNILSCKNRKHSINLPTCWISHYNCLNYIQNRPKLVYSQPKDITGREDPKQMYEKTHFSTFFSATTACLYILFCFSGSQFCCVGVFPCKGRILHTSLSVPTYSSLDNMMCFW